jgi:SynChlorMet cassette protein ScmD
MCYSGFKQAAASPRPASPANPGQAQRQTGGESGGQPRKGVSLMELRREKPIANPVVVLREEFDDWAVLFNPDTADAVGINPVGVAVWKMMDGRRGLDEILAQVRAEFAGVPESAGEEVSAFVADLAERGFVGYKVQGGG